MEIKAMIIYLKIQVLKHSYYNPACVSRSVNPLKISDNLNLWHCGDESACGCQISAGSQLQDSKTIYIYILHEKL